MATPPLPVFIFLSLYHRITCFISDHCYLCRFCRLVPIISAGSFTPFLSISIKLYSSSCWLPAFLLCSRLVMRGCCSGNRTVHLQSISHGFERNHPGHKSLVNGGFGHTKDHAGFFALGDGKSARVPDL